MLTSQSHVRVASCESRHHCAVNICFHSSCVPRSVQLHSESYHLLIDTLGLLPRKEIWMSIAAFLQTELVALSNEARRKHPEIKEVTSGPGHGYK
jgi:hypothetical protein